MFKKGHIPWHKGTKGKIKAWNKGIPNTDEQKKKISNALRGRPTWNKGLTGIKSGPPKGTKPWNTGKPWSKENREKISKGRKGKGKRKIPLKKVGWRLQNWSKAVILRDGKCTACGSKEILQAHHILPRSLFPDKMYDVDNGICLCEKCHKKTDTYGKRLDLKDETTVRTIR